MFILYFVGQSPQLHINRRSGVIEQQGPILPFKLVTTLGLMYADIPNINVRMSQIFCIDLIVSVIVFFLNLIIRVINYNRRSNGLNLSNRHSYCLRLSDRHSRDGLRLSNRHSRNSLRMSNHLNLRNRRSNWQ